MSMPVRPVASVAFHVFKRSRVRCGVASAHRWGSCRASGMAFSVRPWAPGFTVVHRLSHSKPGESGREHGGVGDGHGIQGLQGRTPASSGEGNSDSNVKAADSSVPEGEAKNEVAGGEEMSMMDKYRAFRDKVKVLWKRYGIVAIGTYWTLYTVGMGGTYLLLDAGVIEMDLGPALDKVSGLFGEQPHPKVEEVLWNVRYAAETSPVYRNAVLSWVTAELMEPVRLLLVLGLTPKIARAVGRAPKKGSSEESSG